MNDSALPSESTNASDPESARTRRILILGLITVSIAGFIIAAGKTHPVGARPLTWTNTEHLGDAATETLRVTSFNIHGGKGLDGERNLERIAKLLEGSDIVGLNEVHHRTFEGTNQAHQLGQRLKLAAAFAPTERRWGRDHFGNGLLSRIAINDGQQSPLTGTYDDKFRNIITGNFEWQRQNVWLLITHIDRTRDRKQQLKAALEMFEKTKTPAILMGDFNTTIDDNLLSSYFKSKSAKDAVGTSADCPQRIDWILTCGFEVVSSQCVTNDASDHPMVTVELKLSGNR